VHQAAGGVVDIDEQRALRTAILEPPMLGTVDLHQLTQTITPCPRLVDALQSVFSPNPKTGTDHPLPQRLDAEVQAMKLRQLLRRQGRTKNQRRHASFFTLSKRKGLPASFRLKTARSTISR
jgi:hypothetical protein